MTTTHRLVDYFVISGLDIESGLEPDLLSGEGIAPSTTRAAGPGAVCVVMLTSVAHSTVIVKTNCSLLSRRTLIDTTNETQSPVSRLECKD